jgi:glucose-6-phosphate 1-dehydrogenase
MNVAGARGSPDSGGKLAPSSAPCAPAATLVIFGAMGDLARRLLIPSILNLWHDGLLADGFEIIGVSHHDETDEDLRNALDEFASAQGGKGGEGPDWDAIRARIHYHRGDFNDDAAYRSLAGRLKGNAAFYLATAPSFFATIVERLAAAGALKEDGCFRRVLIEKPFGSDLASARALNQQILACIPESQIYRVDHFLGKETVQNIMVARFANTLFEAVWNNRYIDHVQITAAETVTVGSRGSFYDATGALRDMVPNHLFQLVAMIAMEPPNSFAPEAIRDEKAKAMKAVRPPAAHEVKHVAARGRYGAGEAGGQKVRPYLEEAGIPPDSRTETYAALKLEVETWRWAGVPFYLRTGKALTARDTEIVVEFKPVPFALFRDTDVTRLPPNRLVLQIQPDEGIDFEIMVKRPGPVVETAKAGLDFAYANHFTLGRRTGYETLLYDALIGDQTLFQRADMIEAGWAAVDPVLEAWKNGEPEDYPAGGAGPVGADALLARDGRLWHRLGR